jgi:hypothetical protein
MSVSGFWRTYQQENRRAVLQDYGLINKVWYLFPQGGGPRGSFTTFTDLAPNLRSRDLIYLSGVLQEQATAPTGVFDVTIMGAANRPRQATDGGVPTGGGASWLAPASPVALTPLLTLREQGWRIENIQFAPVASSACIRLSRAETVALKDASHAEIVGCYFVGGGASGIGIEDVGGCSRVLIEDCRFELLTGTAIKGISTGIAVPLGWRITKNRFNTNTNAIAMSLTEGLVDSNFFRQTANDSNNKVNLVAVAAQGSLNQVYDNLFSDAVANITIAKGYKPGTTDVWRNWATDTAAYIVAVPA